MTILSGLVSIPELAAEAGVSTRTVNRWVTATTPGLPVVKLGRRPLIRRADFAEWLAGRRIQHNPIRPVRQGGAK